jgi:hypothetical protein
MRITPPPTWVSKIVGGAILAIGVVVVVIIEEIIEGIAAIIAVRVEAAMEEVGVMAVEAAMAGDVVVIVMMMTATGLSPPPLRPFSNGVKKSSFK